MAQPEKPSEGDENDVLSNLPRSRRQRPSARREEARAARDAGTGAPNGEGSADARAKLSKAAAAKEEAAKKQPEKRKPAAPPAHEPAGHEERERPRKRVPAAGYATVREPGSYGNADPDELLKSFVRGILRRLPG
jgi:hypothetical protein